VPLSGWLHHSATTGFAPIWPPISNLVGQSLPLVPKSETLAHLLAGLHITFERVLVIAILLHVAGALKHHFIDKDLTLKRMMPGHTAPDILPEQRESRAPLFTALALYGMALAFAAGLGLFNTKSEPSVPKLAEVSSGWVVQDGTLGLTVRQLGSDVTGEFQDWTAAIEFSETPDSNGLHGQVDVTIAIGSLKLGSVTAQALGTDFFASEAFPTATFTAPITSTEGRYAANGSVTIKGASAPVNLPFTLQIDGDSAKMQGQATLNRTSFKIGESYPDESSVAFDVLIDIQLTATRKD
jgi:polyisoprenoid-binding protein YceI